MDFFLLRLDQIVGDNSLSIFKKMGFSADYTDFSMLLGGKNKKWWTMTPRSYGPIAIFGDDIYEDYYYHCTASWNKSVGVRPAIKYSTISHFCKNERKNSLGVTEVEFGEYPRSVDKENDLLYDAYFQEKIHLTDKSFRIVNPRVGYAPNTDTKSYPVYKYNGKRIIYIKSENSEQGNFLSNGDKVKGRNIYTLDVEPIVWLVDEEADLAISKNILFAGVVFNEMSGYYELEDFEESFMKKYLNEIFAEDIKTQEIRIFEEEHLLQKKMQ